MEDISGHFIRGNKSVNLNAQFDVTFSELV